ncbi:MAG: 9-O-acetylesterase [Alphaproteobacteria bacterium]|nr:9-O-acetylesterase [Alphaproteobacteria bacterium]
MRIAFWAFVAGLVLAGAAFAQPAGRGAAPAGRGAFQGPQPAPPPGLLHAMFQDHAVLQRGEPIRVYGDAPAGTSVNVTLGTASASGTADSSGHWLATLPAMQAGGPYTLTATGGGKSETANDVLVGDVFLCTGQSNMAFGQSGAANAAADARGATDSQVRQLNIPTNASIAPLASFANRVNWTVESPDTVGRFSAACWYMVRDLKKTQNVPMGMVVAAWGGARIRNWISEPTLKRLGYFNDDLSTLDTYKSDPQAAMRMWGRQWESWYRGLKIAGPAPWEVNFDDSSWAISPNPGQAWALWHGDNPDGFIGQMWMRTTINLTAAQAAQAANLDLGSVNEEDETWVNGKDVGGTSFSNKAEHVVSPGILKEGRNVIVSNIFCSWRNCGFRGPDENRVLRLADGSSVVLNQPWRYKQMSDKDDIIAPMIPWGVTHGLTMDYNGMVSPIGAYNFKAAVWYQGESDLYFASRYRTNMAAMMGDWRALFRNTTLPFLIVQIPNYGEIPTKPTPSYWSDVREAQRLAVKDDKYAALTVNVDIGDPASLHPTNKQEAGRRLAIAARHIVYGEPVPPSGPEVTGAARNGDSVTIRFAGINGKLVGRSGVNGFELCGATQASCRWAAASISGNGVTLAKAGNATRVRYCWGDAPVCTLYDTSGLPAGPFEVPISGRKLAAR